MKFLDYFDFRIGFCNEKIQGKGEDAWCYSVHENGSLTAVFDGCGGLGAAVYDKIQGHSGAYLASRAAAGAFMDWFGRWGSAPEQGMDQLKERLMAYFGCCRDSAQAEESKLRGSMVRLMPTTAAAWVTTPSAEGLRAVSISAGDSRTFLLNKSGLTQVSRDDIDGEDALSNLEGDAPMTNVLSADGNFFCHCNPHTITGPCLLICATDGCFGYLPSPMDFERLLLETLMQANSPLEWEARLSERINEIAGDDQALLISAYGYGSFEALKKALSHRQQVVTGVMDGVGKDYGRLQQAWQAYKPAYYRMTEGGIPERVG